MNSTAGIFTEEFLIFDGGLGTALQARGSSGLSELCNITMPDAVLEVHREFVRAGSHVVTANTFQANANKLKDTGYSVAEVVSAGVKIARQSGAKYVALDIGSTGQLLEPLGKLSFEEAYELYKEQVIAGADADIIVIETVSDLHEAKAAILAAKENSDLPVFCTFTFQTDGRTFLGCDPATVVLTLQSLGADAVGVNCSLGPREVIPIVEQMRKYAKVPLMVQPNAGLPSEVDGCTVFDVAAEEFSGYMKQLAEMGVKILGGCCGTTPEYIRLMCEKISGLKYKKPEPVLVSAATSGTKTVFLDNGITLIGERINPTGKKKLKEALRSSNFEFIAGEAIDQVNAGADILDVNTGLPEIDETEMLVRAVKEVSAVVNAPLQIDSADARAIEAAVRFYNGRPIINSVNGKEEVMREIFPIVKKYGCLVVGLTLDESGIPETADERFDIAEKILRTAISYGIPREDVLIDCLVLTASSHQKQVMTTLNAIKQVKRKLGLKTVLGVSNVSFGMPNRVLLNSTFLAAAFGAGLDVPILNPMSEEIMAVVNAFKVINAQDTDGGEFIRLYGETRKPAEVLEKTRRSLRDVIVEGRKDESAELVKELLKAEEPLFIVDKYFIPALDEVGAKYETGEIFLPQLMRSAETVKKAFDTLKENMPASNESTISKGKILLATVKGDVHDIGKNIVKVLLENYGFEIIDLGKDVAIEEIVQTALAQDIKLIGLSALMTTTVRTMKDTVTALKENNCKAQIMVGGAVLSEEYAKFVGADFYAKDAREGVRIANGIFGDKQ